LVKFRIIGACVPLLLTLFAVPTYAVDYSFSTPVYSGSGCPYGTAHFALSPDGSALTVLYDAMVATANYPGQTDRANCVVSIPLVVPEGYQVAIVGVDYRGFVNVPNDGASYAYLSTSYYLSGSGSVPYERWFEPLPGGPDLVDNYLESHTLELTTENYSSCGTDVVLNMDTQMAVYSDSGYETSGTVDTTEVTIDGAGSRQGVTYSLTWQRCGTTWSGASQIKTSPALAAVLVGGLLAFLHF
jgi:hypothetical protein